MSKLKSFFFKVLKLLLFLSISIGFFYFFETPFLIETAWAEETISETPSNKTESEVEANTNKNGNETAQVSWFKKCGYFLWDYKWHILIGSAIIASSIFFYVLLTTSPPISDDLARGLVTNPNLPDPKYFVEDLSGFKQNLQVAAQLPEHFQATKVFFETPESKQLTGLLVNDGAGGTLPFRVYPAKPILLADAHHPVFDVAAVNAPSVIVAPSTPFLYAEDPSTSYWITHAVEAYPMLADMHPSLMLQYQKVALVDPMTLEYAYFHQVSVVPVNVEALSTPYETHLDARLLKVFFFKDNEAGWYH